MLSDSLDLTIESHSDVLWIYLSGFINKEEVINLIKRIEDFVFDGNSSIVIDMNGITTVDAFTVESFLRLYNTIRGRGGELKFIFNSPALQEVFAPYKNIFQIYSSEKKLTESGFVSQIKKQGLFLSKKTGVRLSLPVALFLLFILSGWYITLGVILSHQSKTIREQNSKLIILENKRKVLAEQNKVLNSKFETLEQLGVLKDSE